LIFELIDLGECGEVCEIFQWKGTLESELKSLSSGTSGTKNVQDIFSEMELIHIGEEAADVFIYTTRLCDRCDIDLGKRVIQMVNTDDETRFSSTSCVCRPWTTLSFDIFAHNLRKKTLSYRSPRQICLELQHEVGQLTSLFSNYSEDVCQPGLSAWKTEDKEALVTYAVNICVLMICLTEYCGLSIGQCITDKFVKNAKKYPADKNEGKLSKIYRLQYFE
jgi:NTP pyrophosphatase (non-canonical NTP hydrolase)